MKFLEYWGVIDKKYAYEVGLDIPENMSEFDQVQGKRHGYVVIMLLRCVMNPFTPARIPYQAFPFEMQSIPSCGE